MSPSFVTILHGDASFGRAGDDDDDDDQHNKTFLYLYSVQEYTCEEGHEFNNPSNFVRKSHCFDVYTPVARQISRFTGCC